MVNIEVDHSLPAQRVIQSLEQLIEWRGKPKPFVAITDQNISLMRSENGHKQRALS